MLGNGVFGSQISCTIEKEEKTLKLFELYLFYEFIKTLLPVNRFDIFFSDKHRNYYQGSNKHLLLPPALIPKA